ncbi:glycoside hydrolase family 3 protein [Cyathus striatus]|nr:glycoside hydrolase family 3 protein [Cyathus striatus]
MATSDFKNADIDEIVDKLTTDEAILLTAGVGFWHTHQIERLGVPTIKVSDGPNGISGNHFFMSTLAKCLPSSTALGATWDTEPVEQVGVKLLAAEAKLRAASLVLAPTCNIQRNPLGGRSFESFSEDPLLSGLISAAYVKGVQSAGIGATIKHFVGNDKENDRMGYDSIISPRALREIYLMPFMLTQKRADPWAYMTAYNRVNGTHVSENPEILKKILREEWGYKGLVMSDWFGIYSISPSLNAGVDLEMPGLNKWRTLDLVNRSIVARKVTTRTVKARARQVLEVVKRCAAGAPEILDGDGQERTVETEGDKSLMRNVAAQSIVLLKNDDQTLKKVAIVGGNARAAVLSGGGSAALKPSYFISPYQGIVNALGEDVEVVYSEGAPTYRTMPSLDFDLVTSTGERGWTGSWHAHVSDDSLEALPESMGERYIDETKIFLNTSYPKGITRRWTMKLKGYLKERERDCEFEFGIIAAGRAKLYVDGELIVDNWTRQRRGEAFFGSGSAEEKGIAHLKKGVKHLVEVVFCNVRAPADGDEDEAVMDSIPGLQVGGAEVNDADALMQQAVDLAKDADAVIAVVGLNADWETEGYDRTSLALPGRTDELIEKVAAVNKRTVVVTQSGSAITYPWKDKVPAIVHAWYLGNATGDAIADILFGKQNPSGKLSLTFPKRLEDVPSFGHFHSEHGKVRYAEDLFVGYKHYQHRNIEPLFPFGHGLSYTTFSLSKLQLAKPVIENDEFSLDVSLTVSNTGTITGSEVVQVYLSMPSSSDLTHPHLQLRAFKKEVEVKVTLDKYAVSYWEERIESWVVEKGSYGVSVGSSSVELGLVERFEVLKGLEWNGL